MSDRSYSLLLVDDEEANRLLLTRRLEQEGYVVTGSKNGREALELLRLERFDLVLLDMNMPIMNGLETLNTIKSDPAMRQTIVVMLTASNSRENVVHCLSLGAADYLVKPVKPAELRQRVRRVLRKKARKVKEPTMRESTDLTGARVLVVDDQPLNLKMLERRLNQTGYRPISAASGQEAIKLLALNSVDAVLLDINMPGMNGMEVLNKIRTSEKLHELPVIMLSADGQEETIEQCYQLGANDFLSKPYETHELQVRLAVAIEIGRAK